MVKTRGLSVGDIARRSGVAVSALRFYEQKRLIQSERSAGNQRRYSRSVLRRIAIIRVAQRSGVTLDEIAAAFAVLPQDRAPNAADWTRMSAQWADGLSQRISQLQQLRDQLDQCIGCGCLSVESCPLRNREDTLAAKGPGAHLLEGD